jgi:hypothetical protein
MKQEIIIAGFGGQGVLSMGKILAYSGLIVARVRAASASYGQLEKNFLQLAKRVDLLKGENES